MRAPQLHGGHEAPSGDQQKCERHVTERRRVRRGNAGEDCAGNGGGSECCAASVPAASERRFTVEIRTTSDEMPDKLGDCPFAGRRQGRPQRPDQQGAPSPRYVGAKGRLNEAPEVLLFPRHRLRHPWTTTPCCSGNVETRVARNHPAQRAHLEPGHVSITRPSALAAGIALRSRTSPHDQHRHCQFGRDEGGANKYPEQRRRDQAVHDLQSTGTADFPGSLSSRGLST